MKVTMMLCDHAAVADGKLWISGGGWSHMLSPAGPTAIAALISVPWVSTNVPLLFTVELVDADGAVVTFDGEQGPQTVGFEVGLEVGRPPGLPPGTDIDVPVALPVPPLDLPAGRYTWLGAIDGEPGEDRRLPFTVERRDGYHPEP